MARRCRSAFFSAARKCVMSIGEILFSFFRLVMAGSAAVDVCELVTFDDVMVEVCGIELQLAEGIDL